MNNEKLKEAEIKFGNPLYVYDLYVIENQFMKRLGTGLDTVSIEEVRIGLTCGFKEDDITFTPNGVSFREIE